LGGIDTGAPSRIIRARTSRERQAAVARAAEILLSGGLVAYPTESFYGLAADATNEKAIERLFHVKRRKPSRPLLILIPSEDVLSDYARVVPQPVRKLISALWPGGVTLVFHASSKVSPLLTAGTDRIGIRLSSHPLATSLTLAAGVPITGTSANISGAPPCRTVDAVLGQFGDALDLVLDGGRTPGEKGSTVLDVTVDPPRILREGLVSREVLERIIPISTSPVTKALA